jgi:hypothetical protein
LWPCDISPVRFVLVEKDHGVNADLEAGGINFQEMGRKGNFAYGKNANLGLSIIDQIFSLIKFKILPLEEGKRCRIKPCVVDGRQTIAVRIPYRHPESPQQVGLHKLGLLQQLLGVVQEHTLRWPVRTVQEEQLLLTSWVTGFIPHDHTAIDSFGEGHTNLEQI